MAKRKPVFSVVAPIVIALYLLDKVLKKCYNIGKTLKKLAEQSEKN